MSYLFTSESVSEGHPDKVADQISDALLDEFLKRDPDSKVACETMVTTGLVICAGEVRTTGYIDVQETARNVIEQIGYTKGEYMFESKSCGVISAIHEQSPDINRGVVRGTPQMQGAGDQGMMFGYATNETENYMPLTLDIANRIINELTDIRKLEFNWRMDYLRPDAKSQVTIEYNDKGKPVCIDTIVVSVQHDDFESNEKTMLQTIKEHVEKHVIPAVKRSYPSNIRKLFRPGYKLHVNPTGKFVIGGPHGDTGLTGRKIVVDTYGGKCPHGGGAFSGKDSSKVDRSAAYAARHIAKNLVAAGVANEVTVQIAYAIGVAEPVSLYIDTHNSTKLKNDKNKIVSSEEITQVVKELFDLTPYGIITRLGLKNPIYLPTAAGGHFGREPYKKKVEVFYEGDDVTPKSTSKETHYFKEVEFFPWEKLDYIVPLKKAFHKLGYTSKKMDKIEEE
ncbi:MAG: methionine adenosyltransferase [Bacteroidales bacterium]|jgi:S-adenosylmethionine synthetase|nr:methionine adenosyltransferase [Bacteroidales bacterium]